MMNGVDQGFLHDVTMSRGNLVRSLYLSYLLCGTNTSELSGAIMMSARSQNKIVPDKHEGSTVSLEKD